MAQAPVKVRRVDLYPDDFLTGTTMLDDTELGVYFRACLLIYATGGPIKLDHLRSISRSHGHTFNRCLKTLLKLCKLTENDGQISNKRCANELQRARKRLEHDAELKQKKAEINGLHTQRAHARSTGQPTINNHHTTYGPLRDPVEIAKERGLRK